VNLFNPAAAGAVLALFLGLGGCKKAEPARAATSPSGSSSPAAPTPGTPASAKAAVASPAVPEAVNKLLGRWIRVDGGYALELRNPDVTGALEAGYFNPKPIKVSRAIWMQGGSGLQVVVELNDVGYPGATYVLTHDAQTDRLVGQYTQPAMQQSFDIDFVRQKPVPLR
jgi:hypothetical protein